MGYYLIAKRTRCFEVRRLKEFNLPLLDKWCWRIQWVYGIRCYVSVTCRKWGKLCVGRGGGSVRWQTVNNIREGVGLVDWGRLLDNICRKVGDESSTLFWNDPWLDGRSLKDSFRSLFELADNKLATVAEMFSLGWGVNDEAWK